ncbi:MULTISPECIES: permease [Arthrobacter]|uniref:Permease n=1 Tax=Arthrobacter psychrochitiniphilus TaxID=291045 RepID=A0A2V3DSV9_9MICC|nr:permease [Arthrobacter psychrochitiniphilus]NYG18737.1 hypothetical protein [Arthrobacter psychrochitiniphilus]PXA66335.1 permease [Arthrobacter psychrochitiniphilus]
MKSSIAGLIGIIALALLVAGHSLGLEYAVGVSMALAVTFGYGWPHYLAIPAKKTLGTVIALTGALAALTAGLSAGKDYLSWTAIYIALGFGAIMVVQLIRGTGQKRRLESTLGAGAGVAMAGFACGWVASFRFLGEPGMTAIVAISAAVALLAGMLPWPDRVAAPLAIILAVLAGPLAALVFSDVRIVPAAVLAIVVASIIAAFRRLRTLGTQLAGDAMRDARAADELIGEVSVHISAAETPVQTATEAPAEAAAQSPSETPVESPAQAPLEAPALTPGRIFGEVAAALAPIVSIGSVVYFVEKILLS